MSLTRRILSSSGQLMAANALARALGIVSLPLLTQWLAPSAYGQAAIASTLISLVSVIGLAGMDLSYARGFLSRDQPNGEAVETLLWRLAVIAALVSGAVAAGIWLAYASQDPRAITGIAALVFLGAAGSLLLAMAQTRSRLHNRHGRLALAVAAGGVLSIATTLFLAKQVVPDERALVIGYVVAYLVPIALIGLPAWRQVSMPSGLSMAHRRSVLLIGLPGVVMAPMYWILSSSDRWFLQAWRDSEVVGLYAVACAFGQLGMMVNSALIAIWLPEATRVHEATGGADGDRAIGRLFVRLLLVMMLVWLAMSTVGGDLLRLLTNKQFHAGAGLVPWISSAVFFYGVYHLANTGLFLGRRLTWSAAALAAAGCISLGANAVLIPHFGAMAAAVVQCATFASLATVVWALAQRIYPLPLPTRRISIAFAFTLVVVVAGSRMPPVADTASASTKAVFLVIVCAAVVWLMEPGVLRRRRRKPYSANA